MTDNSIIQLGLFDNTHPEFNARIRRAQHEGKTVYSLVDIMAEFSETEADARFYWRDTKKRLKSDGFDLRDKISQLKLKAKDGKLRLTDCADAETCLRIVQSIPSPKAESIREWLAHLAYERLEEAAQPGLASQRARERDLALLKAHGYGDHEATQFLEARIQGVDTFKQLMTLVKEVCESPNYGQIVNSEYQAMFGKVASELRVILDTKSVRDALPALQLSYLRTAELGLQQLVKQSDHLTMPQILAAIASIVRPLGEHLRVVCNLLGIDPITGKPQLKSNHYRREDEL